MKFEFLNIESLSNNELLEVFGGQQEKPHGIFQWMGYGIAATVDALSHIGGGSGAYHDTMSSSNYGGIR